MSEWFTEWRLDSAELNRIARRWGIFNPVKVERRTRRYDRRTGLYTVRRNRAGRHVNWANPDGSRYHRIQLTNDPDLEYMLRTLAHELDHARQSEALGVFTFGWLYSGFRPARLGFRGKPKCGVQQDGFEHHAELAEDRWQELLPAVRIRDRIVDNGRRRFRPVRLSDLPYQTKND